jgi:hypothetical protein
MRIGVSRTEPTSSVPMRAVNDSSMAHALAQPIGRLGEAAGTEGALVQALDRRRVVGRFRQNGERGFGHRRICPCARLAFDGFQVHCRALAAKLPCRAQG